jgi:hypothetical protein
MKGAIRTKFLLGLFFLLVIKGSATILYPQAGVEYYSGANKFRSLKPWLGVRISLSASSSVLWKYTFHDLSFDYQSEEGIAAKRESSLSQFIGAFYHARNKMEGYLALSYFRGTDNYSAYNFDGGAAWKLNSSLALEGGLYLLDESSVLWYPDEPARRIQLGAIKAGLKINLSRFLEINPLIYFYQNSEQVRARTVALSLTFIPRDPFYLVVTFWDYRESAEYRFSGQYLSLGLHIYY